MDEKKTGLRGWIGGLFQSVRTRYALATAAFLLILLTMSYVGGRIVLIHYSRDTEQQVQQMGYWTVRDKVPRAFSATTDVGGAAKLKLRVVSYGTLEASDTVDVTADGCISGTTAAVYRGKSLLLDSLTKYLPEAAEGVAQTADDYDGVTYGSRPEGYSMGAYECPTPKRDPEFEVVSTEWYHNRADGLYYPRIVIRYLGGDAARVTNVTFACEGERRSLPEDCLAELRGAEAVGEEFAFGVDSNRFVVAYGRTDRDGYITWETEEESNRFRVVWARRETRPLTLELAVETEFSLSEVVPVAAQPRLLASALPRTVDVPATFGAFGVGARLTGRAVAPSGARVRLYGAETLAGAWRPVAELTLDREGRFEADVPARFRFFRLKAEVMR